MIPKHYRIHAVLIVSVLVMIIFPMISDKPDKEKTEMATPVAMQFLELVDSGEFEKSWQSSADLLKEKIPKEEWVEHLRNARENSGPVVERVREDIRYSKYAHDSPDGEYIVLIFDTEYQKVKELTETVTVMLDKDGRWRVAGYFIQ